MALTADSVALVLSWVLDAAYVLDEFDELVGAVYDGGGDDEARGLLDALVQSAGQLGESRDGLVELGGRVFERLVVVGAARSAANLARELLHPVELLEVVLAERLVLLKGA